MFGGLWRWFWWSSGVKVPIPPIDTCTLEFDYTETATLEFEESETTTLNYTFTESTTLDF